MNAEPAYALLAVGVNQTPGAENRLRHAELDAVRLAIAVTSAKGAIPPANAAYLLSNTRVSDLDRELDALAKKHPDFLMFYFGGHGNAHGIGLADGLFVRSAPQEALRDPCARLFSRVEFLRVWRNGQECHRARWP